MLGLKDAEDEEKREKSPDLILAITVETPANASSADKMAVEPVVVPDIQVCAPLTQINDLFLTQY